MALHRSVLAAATCLAALVPATAVAAAPAPATVKLSAAGQRALAARSLTLSTIPRSSGTLQLATGTFTVGTGASIELRGTLRFTAGRRTTAATRLKVAIRRTGASGVTARLGGRTVRLLAIVPTRPALIDAAGRRASLSGARISLTAAGATRLKSLLKLKRTPPTSALGTLTVAVGPAAQPLPAPAPAPAPSPSPLPAPAPTATPAPPAPTPACAERFAATPAGSVDWFGCDLPGSGDLRSWTDYVQRAFGALPGCSAAPGTVVASAGAARLAPATAYDHRLPIASTTAHPGGSTTIVTQGTVTYAMPAHGIDERIGALRLELAADGRTGVVYASGYAKPRDMGAGVCATAPQDYADEPVLTLDLAGIAPVIAGGVKRWVHVPARIAAGSDRIGGGVYGAGAAWGAFTIAVGQP